MQVPRDLFIFLAYAHDIGKASPIFQTSKGYNSPVADGKVLKDLQNAGYTNWIFQEITEVKHGTNLFHSRF